jgi:hypothetical protein
MIKQFKTLGGNPVRGISKRHLSETLGIPYDQLGTYPQTPKKRLAVKQSVPNSEDPVENFVFTKTICQPVFQIPNAFIINGTPYQTPSLGHCSTVDIEERGRIVSIFNSILKTTNKLKEMHEKRHGEHAFKVTWKSSNFIIKNDSRQDVMIVKVINGKTFRFLYINFQGASLAERLTSFQGLHPIDWQNKNGCFEIVYGDKDVFIDFINKYSSSSLSGFVTLTWWPRPINAKKEKQDIKSNFSFRAWHIYA